MKQLQQAIKAEFRKIFTVRSTYVVAAIAIAIVAFFTFYVEGFKSTGPYNNPGMLAGEATSAVTAVGGIIAIVGVLLFTHEYRYNTIMYTLISTRRRSNIVIAKIVAVSAFALFLGLIISLLAPLLTALALQLRGVDLVHQVFSPLDLLWRCLFTAWGFSMIALMFSMLLRHQVASIVALFILPSTVEPLLGTLLKNNASYLPYNALVAVLSEQRISHVAGAVTVLVWLTVGFIAAWQLLLRRDAN